ncbi:MAG: type VI secretion system baseplate subunit TssF [Aquisalimonadaceae bacterium]
MDEALLSFYNRELAYLRKLGAEFGERHPKIAGRLRLDKDIIEDPHVSRLIESFAFLTARIRHKLDDSFPELTEALMGLLYPDFHAPVPSLGIARFSLEPGQLESRALPAGTELETSSNPLGRCIYHTCFDVEALPLTISAGQFSERPFRAPALPGHVSAGGSQAVLRMTLTAGQGITLPDIAPTQLRFFLNGQPQLTFRLYEFLLNHVTGLMVAEHANDANGVFLSPDHLRPCGLNDHEAAIPIDGRSSCAHRLLTEYFAFPEKFLFVELTGIEDVWERFRESATLFIYFDSTHAELVQGVSEDSLLLGCTPIVNLFRRSIESMPAGSLGYESRLSVSASQTECADIHTLEAVYALDSAGKRIDFQPFYGSHRSQAPSHQPFYWSIRREISQWYAGRISRGTDTYLSLVDGNFTISAPDSTWIINGEALCTNRDLPDKMPFGPDQPQMEFCTGTTGVLIRCVTAPTSTIQPRLGNATRWQLISQLSMQHFAGDDGLQTLKETLRLYDFRQAPESRAIIDGIVGLKTSLTSAWLARDGRSAICQGTRVELELDEQFYSGSGLYLFTAILSRFFAQCCTVNTFVQLTVHIRQRPGSEIQWPPRSGEQCLI